MVVEDLIESAAAGASSCQSSASGFGVSGGFVLRAPETGNSLLHFLDLLFESASPAGGGLPFGCGGIGALLEAERFFEQLTLFGLETRLRFSVVCQSFLGLPLLAVEVDQIFCILTGFPAKVFK